mgnify:CR=1 FL=1
MASSKGVSPFNKPDSLFAFTSASLAISSSATSLCPSRAARCKGVLPLLSFAFTSALLVMRSSETSLCPSRAARCKGVIPPMPFAFTSAPPVKCCLTASMFPLLAASISALSASDNGFEDAAGCVTSATRSAGLSPVECCAFPHPTKSTATIIVSSKCFTSRLKSSRGNDNCLYPIRSTTNAPPASDLAFLNILISRRT